MTAAPNAADTAAGTDETVETAAPAAGLRARGLTVTVGRGGAPVVGPVDLDATAGRATLLVGAPASGRSTLLAAVSGRMRGTRGTCELRTATALVTEPRGLRRRSAVARLADLVVPEPAVTVATAVAERARLDGVRPADGRRRFAAAVALLAPVLPPEPGGAALLDRRVQELHGAASTALAVALARVAPADLVVVDDVDRGTTGPDDLAALLAALDALAAGGDADDGPVLEPCVLLGTALAAPPAPGVPVLTFPAPSSRSTS